MPTQRKILTVVLLSASAGCGVSATRAKPVAEATPPAPVPVPKVAASAARIEPVLVASAIPARPAIPPVVADEEQPEALMRLRGELYGADDLTLNLSHEKFRALCDENGYPVVGNVASKAMRHDVSSYCEDVRTQLVMR
jgi:hypothetical protein